MDWVEKKVHEEINKTSSYEEVHEEVNKMSSYEEEVISYIVRSPCIESSNSKTEILAS